MICKYNREFLPVNGREWGPLEIELFAFRQGLKISDGGLGRDIHFLNIVQELWPDFVLYEWAYEQADALCNYPVSGFTSGASSSKSDLMAKYALVSWYSNPVKTLVIICSTSAQDAKMRIFGHVVRDHRKARAAGKSVGKLIESQSIVKLSESTDGIAASDNSSICLVAAGDEYKDDSLKRLEGRKNEHVILIVDETQDVSSTIVDAALYNLSANPKFEIHIAGNAASRFDPHGMFLTPIEGWNSVNQTTHKWPIRVGGKDGIAMHFDATAEGSPNMRRFAQGIPELPFLRKAEDSLSAKTHLGETNPTYLRQFAGWWPSDESATNYIISEQEISAHLANERERFSWQTTPTDFAGIDPSYSAGGDRFIFYHLQYGLSTHQVWTIFFKEPHLIKVRPQPGETKDHAAVRQCKELGEKLNITPRNIGTDDSAATSFTSILHKEWSRDILPVPFGGAPTDLPVSQYDKRLASDIYCDRSTELLGVLHEFIIQGQIRGMSPQHIKEATSRQYKHVGAKIRLESKKDMKARLGYSPDVLDAGDIGLAVIRERLKIQAGGIGKSAQAQDWKAAASRMAVATRSEQARRLQFGRLTG